MIHPSAFIAPGAVVLGDVSLGRDASVWYNCVVRGDMAPIVIGDETNIQDLTMVHVDEAVPCTIGRRVGVGHRAILHGCTIEDGVLVGMGAVLLNGVHVGAGAVIGAGAVLTEDLVVPPGMLVLGVPARVVRPVSAGLAARAQRTWEHYVAEARRHRAGAVPRHPPNALTRL
ncbi:MAG: gamma carbonic anhydrase family protein [Gemmatimonadota bacterium]|nr:gamma carbonic anhydrase family protein [Gemmatimonadota bacterium]MDH5195622.1 gamma carbonic anhydrase family protein [Gemmatimonadota bacterium]